jgi:HTH-type transcriptional regulator/antitoxin HigA
MKNFGEAPPQSFPCEIRQPDAEEKEILSQLDYPKLSKLHVVKAARSPKDKRTELCNFFQVSNLIDLQSQMNDTCDSIAAFKDTKQTSNSISGGAWVTIGTMAAKKMAVAPYHRDKLEDTIERLREYTQHEPEDVIEEVQTILADAGVALVFIPIMKHSALRGCTRLLSPTKAMIIHSLKYRTLSQFWLILFHEIAHLLLHINTPDDVFAEYADQTDDPKELAADEWARDTLVYSDKLVEFISRHPKPKIWEIKHFSSEIKVHASIIAEVFNRKKGNDVISYAYLRKENLFPSISDAQAENLWQKTAKFI